jgi:hypothetical protein
MRSASSSWARASSRERLGALLLAALALAFVTGGRPGSPPSPEPRFSGYGHHALAPSEQKRLHSTAWLGGRFTASTGETVRVLVSEKYTDAQEVGQYWADYIASLLHGPELGLITAYVVTPDEMSSFCGARALGCYGGNELAFMGETVVGVTPEEVAAHEYGHHVAANRTNPPWLAVDWGPKRWSSVASICSRQRQGDVYPGNESENYTLNPGEAFAEVFRVLNELEDGATAFSWGLVDGSFSPDGAALAAAKEDVLTPWLAPVDKVVRGRFTSKGKEVWTLTMATPLDGNLAITLTLPPGALYKLTLLTTDGHVLGRAPWSGTAEKKLATTICGERSVVLRVTRSGPPGRFSLRITHD